jgi:scyllo-inositol 2-dehydrogenase (NADP+)
LESGVDGQGSVLFKYKEMTGSVMYSKISNSYISSEIQGEEGSLIIDHIDKPNNITIVYKNGSTEDLPNTLQHPVMYYEVKEFIDLIQSGQMESNNNSLTHSMQVMELLDETRKQIGLVFPADR